MNVAISIKVGMAKKGMTQAEVAKAIGKSTSTVSNMCNHKCKLTENNIIALANAFGVKASEFIEWGEE